jgi:uncharacterized damage-inducible protein DinB
VIAGVQEFVAYFDGIRRRTWAAVDRVEPALLDWRPRAGEFTCGEIIRHLAGAERFFVTKVVEDRWTSDLDPGPTRDLAATRAGLIAVHEIEMARLRAMADEQLQRRLSDLDGGSVRAWRFLMAMIEHEVHHRSQLDCWLAEAQVEPPQLYGYRMEDVVARVAEAAPASLRENA